MSALLIKNVPEGLHEKLKEAARKHRRSMTQEAIHILETTLEPKLSNLPEPVQGKAPLTQDLLTKGIKEGRS